MDYPRSTKYILSTLRLKVDLRHSVLKVDMMKKFRINSLYISVAFKIMVVLYNRILDISIYILNFLTLLRVLKSLAWIKI